jgi:hypothetical protein
MRICWETRGTSGLRNQIWEYDNVVRYYQRVSNLNRPMYVGFTMMVGLGQSKDNY